MLDIRKQEIGEIPNSTVIAINGDVTIDGEKFNNTLQNLREVVHKDLTSLGRIVEST